MSDRPDASLHDLVLQCWRGRLYILAGVIFALILSGGFLFAAKPHYRATMLAGPASLPGGAGTRAGGAMDERSQGLAADFTRFENILRGPSVASGLLSDPAMAQGIAADSPLRFGHGPRVGTPEQMADYLQTHVRIEPVGETTLRRIVYDHPDPAFAVLLLRRLHEAADGLIRAETKALASGRIGYLEQASAQVDNPDHRRALTDMLMEQEQVMMMAGMDQPFAAAIAEPPAAGAKPVWPNRTLALPLAALVGAMFGFFVSGFRRAA